MAQKRHKRRFAKASQSFGEAMLASEGGKALYFEAKEREKARIAEERERQERYRTVREQAHELLVANVPHMWFWKKEQLNRRVLREAFFTAVKNGVFGKLAGDRTAYYEALFAMASAYKSPKHLDEVWKVLELA